MIWIDVSHIIKCKTLKKSPRSIINHSINYIISNPSLNTISVRNVKRTAKLNHELQSDLDKSFA